MAPQGFVVPQVPGVITRIFLIKRLSLFDNDLDVASIIIS